MTKGPIVGYFFEVKSGITAYYSPDPKSLTNSETVALDAALKNFAGGKIVMDLAIFENPISHFNQENYTGIHLFRPLSMKITAT